MKLGKDLKVGDVVFLCEYDLRPGHCDVAQARVGTLVFCVGVTAKGGPCLIRLKRTVELRRECQLYDENKYGESVDDAIRILVSDLRENCGQRQACADSVETALQAKTDS